MGISWWPKSSAWAPFLTWSTLPRTRTSLYKISCLVLSSWPSSSGASSSPLQSTWLRSCLDWLSWSTQCGLSMLTSNLTTFFSATHLHLQGDLTLPTLPSAVSFSFLALDWGLKVLDSTHGYCCSGPNRAFSWLTLGKQSTLSWKIPKAKPNLLRADRFSLLNTFLVLHSFLNRGSIIWIILALRAPPIVFSLANILRWI